jgi:hypothetical protein
MSQLRRCVLALRRHDGGGGHGRVFKVPGF